MSERALYVHFEGADLAGKSTASKNFAKALGGEWNIQRNRITTENHIQPLADKIRIGAVYDDEVIGVLYYAALMADIRSFSWPLINTIQDSTIALRSLAFHTVSKTPNLPALFRDLLNEYPRFDLSFVFTASLEKRAERLQKRLKETPEVVSADDTMILHNPNKFLDIEHIIIENAKKHFGSILVDTTNLTENQVLDTILASSGHLISKIQK